MPDTSEPTQPTLELKRILLATDFLESSRLALDYAVALTHRFNATLIILHSLELSPEAEEAEILSRKPCVSRINALSRLQALATGTRRLGIDVQVDLREGESPCAAILHVAAESECDLLVLGTHGIYRGLQHMLIGSNAEKLLLSSCCPTLTVGRHVMAGIDLDFKINNILLVSEPALEDVRSAWYAWQLGQIFGAPVQVMHIRSSDPAADVKACGSLASKYREVLATHPTALDPAWSSAEYHLNQGLDPNQLIKIAEVSVNSLIVSGVRRASRIDRHLHASFAFELAARAACPLLSIPSSE